MASGIYNRTKYNLGKKLMDFSADTFKVILLNNSHSFTASNNLYSDISANELATAGGYTSGGATLATLTYAQDDVNNLAQWGATNTVWSSATFTAYFAVIYDTTVSNSLVACIDFSGAKSVTSGTFTIQWSASGIIRLT